MAERGRPQGSGSKIAASIRDSILSVYEGLGGAEAMLKWALKNPNDYYKICIALMPKNLEIDLTQRIINVNVGLHGGHQPESIPEAGHSIQ